MSEVLQGKIASLAKDTTELLIRQMRVGGHGSAWATRNSVQIVPEEGIEVEIDVKVSVRRVISADLKTDL